MSSTIKFWRLASGYRIVLPLNLGLVVVTVATNYLFIVTLGWGPKRGRSSHSWDSVVEQRVEAAHRLEEI